MAHCGQMGRLHTLQLGWCPLIPSKALAELPSLCPGLTTLDLAHTALDDAALVAICKGCTQMVRCNH